MKSMVRETFLALLDPSLALDALQGPVKSKLEGVVDLTFCVQESYHVKFRSLNSLKFIWPEN